MHAAFAFSIFHDIDLFLVCEKSKCAGYFVLEDCLGSMLVHFYKHVFFLGLVGNNQSYKSKLVYEGN